MRELNIEELKAAALAATPSEQWQFLNRIGEIVFRVRSGSQAIFPLGRMHHELSAEVRANAAYIEAANPATILAMIERLQVAEDAAKRASMGSAETIAYLREQDANTDNACLFVANKVDTGSFAVYTAPLPTDAKQDISEGYLGSTAATTEDGFKIKLHYKSKFCGDAAYTVITDLIDASIDANELLNPDRRK